MALSMNHKRETEIMPIAVVNFLPLIQGFWKFELNQSFFLLDDVTNPSRLL